MLQDIMATTIRATRLNTAGRGVFVGDTAVADEETMTDQTLR
jgi:hypothetical protein